MRYKIGLDIGITSVGWATIELNEDDEPRKILDMGVHTFEAAENPKTGEALALPRRMNRGARRRLRRHRHRLERIKLLLEKNNIMTVDEIDKLYLSPKFEKDVYQIRYESLNRKLERDEFVRLLIHLAQRRGFKSNRKVEENDKKSEAGALTSAVTQNADLLKEKKYRTVGEMLYKDEKFKDNKRNKSENYSNTISRALLCEEIGIIFESQRENGNQLATKELEEKYIGIYTSQRSFDEGPGGESPYGGNQIEKMTGKCQFIPDEPRGQKAQYSVEYCNMLQKVNSIKIITANGKNELSAQQRKTVVDLFLTKSAVDYSVIRKTLAIPEDAVFNISYGDGDIFEIEKKTKLRYMEAYQKMKKAFGESFKHVSNDKRDVLGYALSVYKNDDKIKAYLVDNGLSCDEVTIALTLPSFSKTGNVSVKFCKKIIPFLEEGMLYDKACVAAGYDFHGEESEKQRLLPANAPELSDLKNPVVRRAVSRTIKVVNSIIRKYGESPSYLSVETARELANDFEDRRKITKNQEQNREANDKRMESIRTDFKKYNATGMDLIKLKLWEEQDGICPYSQRSIARERLFEIGYVDIDHIVPYSLCFDDSYNNKVLVFSDENRQKGNRLPLQYLKDPDRFTVWVNTSMRNNSEKRKRLLKPSFTEDDEKSWKSRNLNDTKYISRFLLQYIRKHLIFADNSSDRKEPVMAVNGSATAYVRKRWGIKKVREDGDLHHSVDAVVIACVTNGMIKRISTYSKQHEINNNEVGMYDKVNNNTGELITHFPTPYPHFRDELEMRISNDPNILRVQLQERFRLPNYDLDENVKPIFVSRMPNRKVGGAAHKETIRGKTDDDGYVVSKVALSSLKLIKNQGSYEIENYYNASSDKLLYEALIKRLIEFNGDAKKAFSENFYKPKSDGTSGNLVKKVKLVEKSTLTVPVHGNTAVADNDSMVRVDVFYVDGEGYYLIPIYVADTLKNELPQKAIAGAKGYDGWKKMNDENFIFSIYPNDLIKVTAKKESNLKLVSEKSSLPKEKAMKDILGYYKGTDISTGTVKIVLHDNTYFARIGVKGLLSFEKFDVDVLGNITKLSKEKRQSFDLR